MFDKQPDEMLREASAYSAGLNEVWTELKLIESYDRSFLQVLHDAGPAGPRRDSTGR